MEKHKCIITGATGYIGSHLVRHLLERQWDVCIIAQPQFGYRNIEDVLEQIKVFEYETSNITNLIDFFSKEKPDVVFHLAAAVITNVAPEQIPVLVQSNIQFGTEILEAMKHAGTKHFVTTGSYWQNYNCDTYNPVDLYAATKEAFEKMVEYYVDAEGFHAASLRLFDVYGEDDRRPKLWNKLYSIAGTTEEIDVSAGEQLLDMIHINDVCAAYEAAYEHSIATQPDRLQVYGVCTGRMLPLRQIVDIFEQSIGKHICVNWGRKPYRAREVMKPKDNYLHIPGWKAKIQIEEGFARFAQNWGG